MPSPTSPQFVVIDASVLIGLCASEPGKLVLVQAALQNYVQQGATFHAPHLIVMEALYILCQKRQNGSLTAARHVASVALLQAAMTTIQPPANGDASLIARAEAMRGTYGCSHSADGMYLALAEQLAALGPTELLTFDAGQKQQAAAMAPAVTVNLLVAVPPTP